MRQAEFEHQMKTMLVEKQRQRKVKNLVLSLMVMLHIDPHGRNLIAVCGTGDEHDNSEAIHHWVEQETCCASCLKTISFKKLQGSFLRYLIDTTGYYPEEL
jgi:hypothetical protein